MLPMSEFSHVIHIRYLCPRNSWPLLRGLTRIRLSFSSSFCFFFVSCARHTAYIFYWNNLSRESVRKFVQFDLIRNKPNRGIFRNFSRNSDSKGTVRSNYSTRGSVELSRCDFWPFPRSAKLSPRLVLHRSGGEVIVKLPSVATINSTKLLGAA